MIDLTPLDVRKKKGDFRKVMRGYDPDAVDNFLDEVVGRMEELVRENSSLSARFASMTEAIADYRERERAMNEALVSAPAAARGHARAGAARGRPGAARGPRARASASLPTPSARLRWRSRRCAACRRSACASCASSARWWSGS
jgi:DivIVA domain-containing protein